MDINKKSGIVMNFLAGLFLVITGIIGFMSGPDIFDSVLTIGGILNIGIAGYNAYVDPK